MTIRTAEDTGLPSNHSDKDTVCPRIDKPPAGNIVPMTVQPPAANNNPAADDSLIVEDASEEEINNQMRVLNILTYFPHSPCNPIQVHG